MKGSMRISNETRKALKYLGNITERTGSDEERKWFEAGPLRIRVAIQKAVEGFRQDEQEQKKGPGTNP